MTDNSRSYLTWAKELGTRPQGNFGEIEKYGELDGRKTYLDHCNCSNPECHGFIARYADDHSLCSTQTLALRHEAGLTLKALISMRERFEDMIQAQYSLMFSAINDSDKTKEALDGFETLSLALPDMLRQILQLKADVASSGVIYFYLDVDEATGMAYEKYRIVVCPTYQILIDQERLKVPALNAGKPVGQAKDDPAKEIDEELPEANSFYDDELLRLLFNNRIKPFSDGSNASEENE